MSEAWISNNEMKPDADIDDDSSIWDLELLFCESESVWRTVRDLCLASDGGRKLPFDFGEACLDLFLLMLYNEEPMCCHRMFWNVDSVQHIGKSA